MSRAAVLSLFAASACAALSALSACQRPAAPVVKAAAAPADSSPREPRGAPDDRLASLMHEAFADWDGKHPVLTDMPGHDGAQATERLAVTAAPELVVAVDATHRVLVVTGSTPDEHDQPSTAQPEPGNLGAHWFVRRHGRWFESGQVASILQAGTSGDVGVVKAADLGAGHRAISVEDSGCWEGKCASWLALVELGPEKPRILLREMPLQAQTSSGVIGCSEALDDQPVKPDDFGSAECGDVTGRWRLEPRPSPARADLVVTFTGKTASKDATTGAVSSRPVDETLVLRDAGDGYKPLSGRNPTPGL